MSYQERIKPPKVSMDAVHNGMGLLFTNMEGSEAPLRGMARLMEARNPAFLDKTLEDSIHLTADPELETGTLRGRFYFMGAAFTAFTFEADGLKGARPPELPQGMRAVISPSDASISRSLMSELSRKSDKRRLLRTIASDNPNLNIGLGKAFGSGIGDRELEDSFSHFIKGTLATYEHYWQPKASENIEPATVSPEGIPMVDSKTIRSNFLEMVLDRVNYGVKYMKIFGETNPGYKADIEETCAEDDPTNFDFIDTSMFVARCFIEQSQKMGIKVPRITRTTRSTGFLGPEGIDLENLGANMANENPQLGKALTFLIPHQIYSGDQRAAYTGASLMYTDFRNQFISDKLSAQFNN